MEKTDKSLLDGHRQGDREAFAELVRRHGDSLLGYLMRMSGNREQAEDLLQETFRRVHEKAHTLRGTQFKSWLFSIATRVAIDGVRRRSQMRLVSLNRNLGCGEQDSGELGKVAAAGNSPDPSQEAIRAEQKEHVRQAVSLLPVRQRAALVLTYYQQLSCQEAAEVMGCSIGTVKTQMYRALRTLAQRLPDVSGDVA